jgi:predicted DNA-binding transcriptional regulator AlpA
MNPASSNAPATAAPVDEFLTCKEVCALLKVCRQTVWYNVRSGRLPAPDYVLPRTPRWRRSSIMAIGTENRQAGTCQ